MSSNNGEQWRDIPGTNGSYEVSDFGRVRRKIAMGRWKAGGFLSPRYHRQGYIEIKFNLNGASKQILAHRLVMMAFVGNPPAGMETNHINGIKDDNRLKNLEYVTPKENTQHAITHLNRTGPRGELNGNSKLTKGDVLTIRKLLDEGIPTTDIAQQYGLSRTHVYHIRKGKVWGHLKDSTNE